MWLHYKLASKFLKNNNVKCSNDDGRLYAVIGRYGLILKCTEHHNILINDFFDFKNE